MTSNNTPQSLTEAVEPACKPDKPCRLNEIEKGQLATDTIRCFNLVSGSLSDLPGLISKIIREKVWERRIHNGRLIELPNLRALITEPFPRGWSEQPDKIEAIIKSDIESLALFREAMVEERGGSGSNQYATKEGAISDNITNCTMDRGNSKAYTVSRLKRDRPDLFERVVAGELSANRAAIEAGFRKVPTTLEQIKSMWSKATPEERTEFIERWWSEATPEEQADFLARAVVLAPLVTGGDS
jgi:hypothetical protein